MYSIRLTCPQSEKDTLIGHFASFETAGIHEQEAPGGLVELRAFFEEQVSPLVIEGALAEYSPEFRQEEALDWTAQAKSSFPPLLVGNRFFLAPEWDTTATPEGRLRLVVNPGLAYGTGAHETTQLCLEAMERHVKQGARLLDVGVGSGILCQAALLLRAGVIVGCDIDPEAARIARGFLPSHVHVIHGSLRSLRTSSMDIVTANINAETVVQLSGELARTTSVDGLVILSGFPPRDAERVHSALEGRRFAAIDRIERNGWTAIIARK